MRASDSDARTGCGCQRRRSVDPRAGVERGARATSQRHLGLGRSARRIAWGEHTMTPLAATLPPSTTTTIFLHTDAGVPS
jgi:hypothetical protein